MTESSWLQNWYAKQCDGVWEHSHGIKISTLDNPGWAVEIHLAGTPYENHVMDAVEIDHGEHDWMRCQLRDRLFSGFGDPSKLEGILAAFRDWVERSATSGSARERQ